MSPSSPQHPIYISPTASTYTFSPSTPQAASPSLIRTFHSTLPSFSTTPLIPLPITHPFPPLSHIYLKSETSRLGLPAFKILGASWATYIALCGLFGLRADPYHTALDQVAKAARERKVVLFAATDGNHGRAVGRMSSILSEAGLEVGDEGGSGRRGGRVQARIFVPYFTDEATVAKIKSEGTDGSVRVVRVDGDYDETVLAAADACSAFNEHANDESRNGNGSRSGLGVQIQDNAFADYTTIPHHVTDGYTTLLHEITSQLAEVGKTPDFIVTPVGAGSLAHAVVKFAKSSSNPRPIKVITVEPEAAACLNTNLRESKHFPVQTGRTMMDGLCCGTVSPTAWPVLKDGVDVSVTIGERECHDAVLELRDIGVDSGPCGAAVLAGLKRVWEEERVRREIGMDEESVIVGIVTEGRRDYVVPD